MNRENIIIDTDIGDDIDESLRVITVDMNPAYPPAIEQLIDEKSLSKETIIRQVKYFNNII
jgi:transposase-like protein